MKEAWEVLEDITLAAGTPKSGSRQGVPIRTLFTQSTGDLQGWWTRPSPDLPSSCTGLPTSQRDPYFGICFPNAG